MYILKLMLFAFYFKYVISLNKRILIEDTKISDIPIQFVKQLNNSYLIIHYNNATAGNLFKIFGSNLTETKGTYLINYDVSADFTRVMADSYINLVLLPKLCDFKDFSNKIYNLRSGDVVFFIHHWKDMPETISSVKYGVHRSAGLFLFNLRDSGLYVCCYYCSQNSGVVRKISKNGKIPPIQNYINNYVNFQGHTFNVAHSHYQPYFYCIYKEKKCIPQGSEAYLLDTLSKYLNFTYNLIQWNRTLVDGTWESMVLAVHDRKIDWALGGISASLRRGNLTDFTRYIHREGYTIAYALREDHLLAIEKFLSVLNWKIYVLCLITVILISFFTEEAMHLVFGKPRNQLVRYIRLACESLIEQSSSHSTKNKTLHSNSIKFLFGIWWLISCCLTICFKSQLASILIKPSNNHPDNIDQLVENGYTFQVDNDDNSVLTENFLESNIPLFKRVVNMLNSDLEFCDSIIYAFKGKIGVIDEETSLQYKVYMKCKLTISEINSLRLVTENLFPGGYHAWSMQEATPFRKTFSKTIGRLNDAGLLAHWYESASVFKITRSNEEDLPTSVEPLSIWNLLPSFIFLLFGILLSIITLFIEIIYNFKKNMTIVIYRYQN